MGQELRIIMVEDVESDAELAERELKRAGLAVHARRVEREEDFRRELGEFRPHVILSDFSMPQFDGMSALRIACEIVPDVPFIFVSGTLGEDYAIRALKNGATDYVLKNNLVRLPPTIERAVSGAAARAERRREEQLLALEHTVVRHIADADSASIGLKAIMRAICETESWDVGRYFRADEKAGVLRFSEAWSTAGSDIERFIEKSRDIRYAPDVGLAGKVWQSGQPACSRHGLARGVRFSRECRRQNDRRSSFQQPRSPGAGGPAAACHARDRQPNRAVSSAPGAAAAHRPPQPDLRRVERNQLDHRACPRARGAASRSLPDRGPGRRIPAGVARPRGLKSESGEAHGLGGSGRGLYRNDTPRAR